ncbi:hypothetical protein SVIOM74S_09842 [Streptomyces violarus]
MSGSSTRTYSNPDSDTMLSVSPGASPDQSRLPVGTGRHPYTASEQIVDAALLRA